MSHRILVNGELHLVDATPDTALLYVLRNDLGLNGPKFGCGLGQCGACAAIVGGELTRTCSIALRDVGEDEVTTLEGLGTIEKPHPLQRSFIDEQAAQCGYCSNGMIMAAKALLDRNPNPSEEEIKNALEDQLCRCGVQIGWCARSAGLQRRSRDDGPRAIAQTVHAVAWYRRGFVRLGAQ